MAFLHDGTTALVTATDGRIWRLNLANHSGAPLVDPPRMAYGIHDAPGDPNHLYFCASGSYSDAAPQERVGLYRFSLDTRQVEPVVLDVPATALMNERPIVYGDNDSGAPELRPGIDACTTAAPPIADARLSSPALEARIRSLRDRHRPMHPMAAAPW